MATVANAQRTIFRRNLFGQRRFRILEPAALAATSLAKLVDAPGLRQSAKAMHDIAVALKAPKRISVQAQEQIDRIDRTLASIRPSAEQLARVARDPMDVWAGYLVEVQVFADKLERLRAKLYVAKDKGYKRKLLYQEGIICKLDKYNQAFLEASREFSVSGMAHANRAVAQHSVFELVKASTLPTVVVRSKNDFKLQLMLSQRNYKLHRLFFLNTRLSQTPPLALYQLPGLTADPPGGLE